jgi:hypothetical protein
MVRLHTRAAVLADALIPTGTATAHANRHTAPADRERSINLLTPGASLHEVADRAARPEVTAEPPAPGDNRSARPGRAAVIPAPCPAHR